MKKKNIIILLIVIALLVGGGIVIGKLNQKEETKSSDNLPKNDSPTKKPLNQLSDKELEKCLLEDFNRRLELKKYFVFGLGELKVEPPGTNQFANRREVKSNLSRDLTKLAAYYEKIMKEKDYKMDPKYVRIPKDYISFMGEDFVNYDKEEGGGDKIDEKINNGKDKFIIFEKDDDPEEVYFGRNTYNDKPGEIFGVYNDTIYLRMKVPTTKVCESKEKVLEIIKTDPALVSKV